MAEVLEIQIQDKGSAAGSNSMPPRPPAVEAQPAAAPRSAPGAAVASQPPGEKRDSGIAESILERLGYGKQVQAFRQIYDLIAGRKSETNRSDRHAEVKPAASPARQLVPRGGSGAEPAGAAFQEIVKHGFGRVEGVLREVADHFLELPQPGAAAPSAEKAARTRVQESPHAKTKIDTKHAKAARQEPRQQETAHRPASELLPRALRVAKEEPPRAPAIPAKGGAAVGEATRTGEAARMGEAAAGAEAAGGALAAVGVAALPVVAVFAGVYAAVKITEAAFAVAGKSAEVMGQQFSMMAHNNYTGMFVHGMQTATQAVSKIPILGGLLGAGMGAATAGVKAFTSVTEAFTQRAHELAGYSPAIAMAEQKQAMRSMFDDIKEANTLGPDMARMLDAETSLQHEMRELFLPIKKVVLGVIGDVMERAQEWLPMVRDALVGLLEAAKMIINLLDKISFGVLHIGDVTKIISEIQEGIKKVELNTRKQQDPLFDPFLDDLLNRGWNAGAGANAWAGINADPRPNIPIVQAFPGV